MNAISLENWKRQDCSQTLKRLEAELQSQEEEMGRLREEHSLPQSQHCSQIEQLEDLEAELQSNGGRPRILNALFKILSTQCELQTIRLKGLETRAMNAISLEDWKRQDCSKTLKRLETELQSHERRPEVLNSLFELLKVQCEFQTILLEDLEAELQSQEEEKVLLEDLEAELQSNGGRPRILNAMGLLRKWHFSMQVIYMH